MKIIVTGSLGNISKPLTEELVQKGHTVTVISSNPQRQKDIEALGATAAIGTLEDADFLNRTFTGVEAAYCMTPFDFSKIDQDAFLRKISQNYLQAIQQAGIKRVVHLSGWAAHLSGPHNVENILNELSDVSITHLRPPYFYYNLYGYVDAIKSEGIIAANFGGDDKLALVSPLDIATVAAEELQTPLNGHKVRYVASDEHTCNEVAEILGKAIGKPNLKWVTITDQEMQQRYEASGIPPQLALGLVKMQAGMHSGIVQKDYFQHRPKVMGSVKMSDFAKEFAAVYRQKA